MPSIYSDGTYLDKNPTWHEEDSRWKATQILRMLKRNHLAPATVCEVGCGAGEILNQLSLHLPATTSLSGYEISPQAFEICRMKSKKNLAHSLGDPLAETSTFDLVLAVDVVEHVENYLDFLRKLKRKGLHKILHVPLEISVLGVLRPTSIVRTREAVGHIHNFMKETALAALKEAGYEIMDCDYTAGSLEVPQRPWRTRVLGLPRKLVFALNPDLSAWLLGGCSLLVLAQ